MSDMTLFEFPYTCISKQEYRWLLLTQNILGIVAIFFVYAAYEHRRANRLEAATAAQAEPKKEL
jgi:hypothetical protein